MRRNITLPLMILPLALAACSTPQEQCINKETREYRVVSDLLNEVQGNLSRGYAWEEREVIETRLGQCRDIIRDKDGTARVFYSPCYQDYARTERYRVPIDPASEQRKRDNLSARKTALGTQAAADVRACKAIYPEQS